MTPSVILLRPTIRFYCEGISRSHLGLFSNCTNTTCLCSSDNGSSSYDGSKDLPQMTLNNKVSLGRRLGFRNKKLELRHLLLIFCFSPNLPNQTFNIAGVEYSNMDAIPRATQVIYRQNNKISLFGSLKENAVIVVFKY